MKISKSKLCVALILVAVCCFLAFCGTTNVSNVTPPEPGTSFNIPYQRVVPNDQSPLQKDGPSIEYECPYEQSELVEVAEFTVSGGQHFATWYIYSFTYDGTDGTWIINDAGNHITFCADVYLETSDNYAVWVGHPGNSTMCVKPDFMDPSSFMVRAIQYRS